MGGEELSSEDRPWACPPLPLLLFCVSSALGVEKEEENLHALPTPVISYGVKAASDTAAGHKCPSYDDLAGQTLLSVGELKVFKAALSSPVLSVQPHPVSMSALSFTVTKSPSIGSASAHTPWLAPPGRGEPRACQPECPSPLPPQEARLEAQSGVAFHTTACLH